MTIKQAYKILKIHQRWRIGEIDEMPFTPKEISEAINKILKYLKWIGKYLLEKK